MLLDVLLQHFLAVISIFETDSKIEADAVAERLRSADIACFIDGEATASLAGFYVPRVLRVCVLDASSVREGRRLAREVNRSVSGGGNGKAPRAPKQRSWIVLVGALLILLGVIGALFTVIGSFRGR